jgi:MFS family permease
LQIWHLVVFGLVEGAVTAFDAPAFQALIVRLVPKSDFQQAIAINSTNYHTSRMIGPLIAAWLLSLHGPSLVFLFDGLTYIFVAFVLSRVKITQVGRAVNIGGGLKDGLRYMSSHVYLRYRILQLMLTISCIYPMMATIFRVFFQQKFSLNSEEFGMVFSFPAIGSMCGALTFAIFKPEKPIRALWFGVPLVFVTLIANPFIERLDHSVLVLTLTAYGLYLSFASLTISMQLEVEDSYRGRLSSVMGMGFSAIGPMMSFPWGHLADKIGAPKAIWWSAGIYGVGSAILGYGHKKAIARAKV